VTTQTTSPEVHRGAPDGEPLLDIQEHLIATIREISTPTLNVAEGVLLLPIIGALDSARALQMLSSLMEAASSMRARVTDFGNTTSPRCTCQRSTTCAGVTPCAAATSASTGASRSVRLNGLYPSSTTPRCASSCTTRWS